MAKKKTTEVEKVEAVKTTENKNRGGEIYDAALIHTKGVVKDLKKEFGDNVIKAALEQTIKEELKED